MGAWPKRCTEPAWQEEVETAMREVDMHPRASSPRVCFIEVTWMDRVSFTVTTSSF